MVDILGDFSFWNEHDRECSRAYLLFILFFMKWSLDLPRPAGANHVHEDDERGFRGEKNGGWGYHGNLRRCWLF